jgi:hypothetical protein
MSNTSTQDEEKEEYEGNNGVRQTTMMWLAVDDECVIMTVNSELQCVSALIKHVLTASLITEWGAHRSV